MEPDIYKTTEWHKKHGLEKPAHECREESPTCRCYQAALEPSDNCLIHGCGEWPPKCGICGRFIKRG